MDLHFEEETYALGGAIFEVYKEKGSGFLEDVYQESLELELEIQDIPFQSQLPLNLTYKGRPLKTTNKKVGLLVNFKSYPKVTIERIVN